MRMAYATVTTYYFNQTVFCLDIGVHFTLMLELTLELDGTVTIAEDEGNIQISFLEGVSFREAINRLTEFGRKLWDSSESFIETTCQGPRHR